MQSRTSLASLVALALCACGDPPRLYGSQGTTAEQNRDQTDAGAPAPDLAQVAYPAGPYGNQIGDTLRDLTLAGYRMTPQQTDSTKLPWDTAIHLADFHANPACTCLLITVGASWCEACVEEQPALITDVSGDPGFCVLGILQEGMQQQVIATRDDVDAWTQQFQENFTVALGTRLSEHLFDGYGSTIGLPFNLIVDPHTMQVLDNVQGFESQIYQHATQKCAGN
jgi:hypothetical protein